MTNGKTQYEALLSLPQNPEDALKLAFLYRLVDDYARLLAGKKIFNDNSTLKDLDRFMDSQELMVWTDLPADTLRKLARQIVSRYEEGIREEHSERSQQLSVRSDRAIG